jgi:hypothetical protein
LANPRMVKRLKQRHFRRDVALDQLRPIIPDISDLLIPTVLNIDTRPFASAD